MFCEKCGTKNEQSAKFCEHCGEKLENNSPNKDKKQFECKKELNDLKDKFENISKKNKIVMVSVLLITLLAIIVLCFLLNNPVKKVEDSLERYYRTESSSKELIYIGKILKENKEKENVLNSIKNTVQNITNNWIKNFNTEYKDTDELTNAYQSITNKVDDIYDYFNGLEYMLDKELYNNYVDELKSFYYSKLAYFEGAKNEREENNYYAYYYYQKVTQDDCYYKFAKKFISNYLKDEIEELEKKANELITNIDSSKKEDVLSGYIDELKYLDSHKSNNNIDLSETEEYKKLYDNALKNIIETSKKIVEEYDTKKEYEEAKTFLENTIKSIEAIAEEDDYKELTKLIESYEGKLPKSLLDKECLSYYGVSFSNYSKTINGIEYKNNLSFSFMEEKGLVTYALNKEYKKLTTSIIKDTDLPAYLNGKLIIYGDNKEIYKLDNVNSTETKIDLNLDVKNINELKIEFIPTSDNSSGNYNIYLVEPYLNK